MRREWFSVEKWDEILYSELREKRPVLYCGKTIDIEGHQFICDGYADGYYHINWGWGGYCDGYFLISLADSDNKSAGCTASGFCTMQEMIVGVQPPVDNKVIPLMYSKGDFIVKDDLGNCNIRFCSGDNHFFYNSSNETINIYLGVKATDYDGNDYYIAEKNPVKLEPSYGTSIYVNFSSLSDGNYILTPIFRLVEEETWRDIYMPKSYSRLIMTKVGSNLDFIVTLDGLILSLDDCKLETPIYINRKFKISANISATIDFAGNIHAVLKDSNDNKYSAEDMYVNLISEQPVYLEYISSFNVPAGDYSLFMETDNGDSFV